MLEKAITHFLENNLEKLTPLFSEMINTEITSTETGFIFETKVGDTIVHSASVDITEQVKNIMSK